MPLPGGAAFYGTSTGVAPGVPTVYNYDADFYANEVVFPETPLKGGIPVAPKVVNQSFIFQPNASDDAVIAQLYDNYVDDTGTIIVSAAGNGPAANMTLVQSPADAYNVISVGALGIVPGSTGTLDGRSKPDITAPGGATSFTTPLVSGIATLLVQAGTPMGPDAIDPRTIKAILLNGAVKPLGWTHTQTAPLDSQTGAGIVNALNSYRNLVAGEQFPTAITTTASLGGPHPAIHSLVNLNLQGWALTTITSGPTDDAVDHYVFYVGTSLSTSVTLTWNRPALDVLSDYDPHNPNPTVSGINNLDLYIYNVTTGAPITASTSLVDNVEQLFLPNLNPGQYDLEVVKNGGGPGNPNWVSDSETYALAWMTNIPGDANLDGKIDSQDLNTVVAHWQTTGQTWTTGDFDGDGKVDIQDLNDVTSNWQAGANSFLPYASLLPAGRWHHPGFLWQRRTFPLRQRRARTCLSPVAGLRIGASLGLPPSPHLIASKLCNICIAHQGFTDALNFPRHPSHAPPQKSARHRPHPGRSHRMAGNRPPPSCLRNESPAGRKKSPAADR